jgi:hypothetical protein
LPVVTKIATRLVRLVPRGTSILIAFSEITPAEDIPTKEKDVISFAFERGLDELPTSFEVFGIGVVVAFVF